MLVSRAVLLCVVNGVCVCGGVVWAGRCMSGVVWVGVDGGCMPV